MYNVLHEIKKFKGKVNKFNEEVYNIISKLEVLELALSQMSQCNVKEERLYISTIRRSFNRIVRELNAYEERPFVKAADEGKVKETQRTRNLKNQSLITRAHSNAMTYMKHKKDYYASDN